MSSSSVLVVGDRLYVTTSNGVDWTGKHTPSPDAPALICLDKSSGKLLAQEHSGISRRTFNCNWSSPAYGIVAGKPMLVFGGGDGFCYGFDPNPAPSTDGSPGTLREIWRCDCNPPHLRKKEGKATRYGDPDGPSEIVATPVLYGERVYAGIGQEPEQGEGSGCLTCIDATHSGDVTETGKVWSVESIGRTVSTVSIADGLLYAAEFTGVVHCLDVNDGKELWSHDTEGHIWGSTLVADGKVYVGNEAGTFTILAAGKQKKLVATADFKEPIYSTPVATDSVLYVATQSRLYALRAK
jgi:outer membrane protein assembly factor BamB